MAGDSKYSGKVNIITKTTKDRQKGREQELRELMGKSKQEGKDYVDGKSKEVINNTREGLDASSIIHKENLQHIVDRGKRFNLKQTDIIRYFRSLPVGRVPQFKYEMCKLGILTPDKFGDDFVKKASTQFIRRYGIGQYKKLA